MADVRHIFPRRGFRQVVQDMTDQDRAIEADNRRLAGAQPGIRQTWGVGNASGTWDGWRVHYTADGYNIWRAPKPNAFLHHPQNELLVRSRYGKVIAAFENRGSATTAGTGLVDAWTSGSGALTNNSAEAATDLGTPFDGVGSGVELYIGDKTPFFELAWKFAQPGRGISLIAEYWNGTIWTSGTTPFLTEDLTVNMTRQGLMKFASGSAPDWASRSVAGTPSLYYIRLRSNPLATAPSRNATIYHVRPVSGVQDLLTRSPEQLFNRQLAWCTFGNYVYATIPNAGPPTREGISYVQSGASAVMRRQYFSIYNRHEVQGAVPKSLSLPMYQEPNSPVTTGQQFREAFSGSSYMTSGTGDGKIGVMGLVLVRENAAGGKLALCVRSGNVLVGVQLGAAGNAQGVILSGGSDF